MGTELLLVTTSREMEKKDQHIGRRQVGHIWPALAIGLFFSCSVAILYQAPINYLILYITLILIECIEQGNELISSRLRHIVSTKLHQNKQTSYTEGAI